MDRLAVKQIADNIRDEFAGIRKDVSFHLGTEIPVDNARELLVQHVPALVIGRARVLLDSLLNYLMEDAMDALSREPTDIKNDFYELDLRARLKGSYSLEPQTLQFSFDPRLVAGGCAAGGTIITGGVIVGLAISGVLGRIIAGLATLVASAAAYRLAHSAGTASARRVVETDVSVYLEQSEAQMTEWLEGVESAFSEAFDHFLSHKKIKGDT